MNSFFNPIRMDGVTMGEKYRMTSSFLDGFKASFTRKESILAGQNYPLGNFVMEHLELDREFFRALDRLVPVFKEELTVFLLHESA